MDNGFGLSLIKTNINLVFLLLSKTMVEILRLTKQANKNLKMEMIVVFQPLQKSSS